MTYHSFSPSLAFCHLPEEVLGTWLITANSLGTSWVKDCHDRSFFTLRYEKPLPYTYNTATYDLIFLFREHWHIIWTISGKMEYAFANDTLQNFSCISVNGFFCLAPLFLPLSLHLPLWASPLTIASKIISFITSHIWIKCFL